MTVKRANIKYGKFEMVIGVPDDYEQHRCQYAREHVSEIIGDELAESWVVQQAKPVDPVGAKDDHTYYRFGGNVLAEELRDD